ncbi:MAG: COX15/CtaA family protein [Bdellovibrionaceae bacterium]|nr:COX15/CtaA family protein [Pseudobdellovibrionaceae bacterium]
MNNKALFHRFAQFLLFYTLLVILWGAWVRISHSGDGCGDTWPLCKGQLIPDAQQKKTWIEFSHRITSGLFGILVIFLTWKGRLLYNKAERIRTALTSTLVFTITEALLGAKLVLFGLVGNNDSGFRLLAMSLHQINSMLLSGSVALVVIYSGPLLEKINAGKETARRSSPLNWQLSWPILMLVVAVTGGLAALSTTLFPSVSLVDGFMQDLASDSHYLLRLRISHPFLASLVGGGAALFFWLESQRDYNEILRKTCFQLSLIYLAAVIFGYLTLLSLTPAWMKIVHLLIAHIVWISLVRWYVVRRLSR